MTLCHYGYTSPQLCSVLSRQLSAGQVVGGDAVSGWRSASFVPGNGRLVLLPALWPATTRRTAHPSPETSILFCVCGHTGSSLLHAHGLSLAEADGGSSSCSAQASRCGGCSFQSTCSVAVAQGLVALRHVGSSQTRDQTHVPCICRLILSPWTTRVVPPPIFLTNSKAHSDTRVGFSIQVCA